MEDAEVQRLLELLDQAIHDTRRSRRDIERSLGLGQGYLGSLFRGRIELKVWHVYRLARELKRNPLSFFFEVSPPQDARWVLKALGLDPDKVLKELPKEPGLAPANPVEEKNAEAKKEEITSEQIEEIVRRSIREELKRRGLGDPDELPKNPEKE
ncbi:MAG TPA: hypothetical protein VKM72_28865 [Thermoanaerobaculia bacterium]|nr:hypothetical protein [Thermoanaerobaculia bacterium]